MQRRGACRGRGQGRGGGYAVVEGRGAEEGGMLW